MEVHELLLLLEFSNYAEINIPQQLIDEIGVRLDCLTCSVDNLTAHIKSLRKERAEKFSPEEVDAISNVLVRTEGTKISQIKRLRDLTNLGLKDAKSRIDAALERKSSDRSDERLEMQGLLIDLVNNVEFQHTIDGFMCPFCSGKEGDTLGIHHNDDCSYKRARSFLSY